MLDTVDPRSECTFSSLILIYSGQKRSSVSPCSLRIEHKADRILFFFVKLAFGEKDMVVAKSLWCMCMCLSVCPFGFVWTETPIFMYGFQDNLEQLFSLKCNSSPDKKILLFFTLYKLYST